VVPSRFNLYFAATRGGEFVLYNTLSAKVRILSQVAKESLSCGCVEAFTPEQIRDLSKSGFLVAEDLDELGLYKLERDRFRFANPTLGLVVLTTYACNLACTYCFVPSLRLPVFSQLRRSMDPATAQRLVSFALSEARARESQVVSVDFVGLGEPLLWPTPLGLVMSGLREFNAKHGPCVAFNLVTNGILLPSCSELLDADVSVQVTVDGQRSYHDKMRVYRSGRGTFDEVMRGIEVVLKSAARCAVRIHVDRENCNSILDLVSELRGRFGADLLLSVVPRLPGSDGRCGWSAACLPQKELPVLLGIWEALLNRGVRLQFPPLLNPLHCRALSTSTFVFDPRGRIYRCEGVAGDPSCCIGDVWNGVRGGAADDNWMGLDPLISCDCRECAMLPACGGCCPHLERYYRGKFVQTECSENKELLFGSLRLRLKKLLPELSL
jgi:uncharacterized protein